MNPVHPKNPENPVQTFLQCFARISVTRTRFFSRKYYVDTYFDV